MPAFVALSADFVLPVEFYALMSLCFCLRDQSQPNLPFRHETVAD